jgi:hypothetical protein
MKTYAVCCVLLLLCACTKTTDLSFLSNKLASARPRNIQYTIKKGEHYADRNTFRQAAFEELRFLVQFDSSAIYQTAAKENQYDINKLYGFSDNNSEHHLFSARFGWQWSDGALRLFAYVYNAGVLTSRELGTINIGASVECSIRISGNHYIFYYGDNWISMPRESTSAAAAGYMLFPYFGGDEPAPHDISINIIDL